MVEQAQEECSASPSQAGPSEVENHMLSHVDMRGRAARLIGHRLAQIGDEVNRTWLMKPPTQRPRHLNWQAYRNMLTWRAINGRMVGILWWSKIMPTVRASWVFSQLHPQACQTTMKWINWVYSHFPDWSCIAKCFLTSAVFLVTAAVYYNVKNV